MSLQLPHIDWLIDDPLQVIQKYQQNVNGWNWNYGPALKKKGWEGVWENFCRLYVYWFALLPLPMGGHSQTLTSLNDARILYSQVLLGHGAWQQKRRAAVPHMPAFIRWLQTIGKPMDAEFLAWYPDEMNVNANKWNASYGNPRKLPASSMYLVNGSRIFSNQNQPDGPFIMSIHTRGYKNAQVNFLAAPYMRSNKQVLTEYSKYKYPPLSWRSALPYESTTPNRQGAFVSSVYEFTSGSPKLNMAKWNNQLIRNHSLNLRTSWNQLRIGPNAPPLYLSIEPQDLGASGSLYKGTLIPSINYCNQSTLPIKYK